MPPSSTSKSLNKQTHRDRDRHTHRYWKLKTGSAESLICSGRPSKHGKAPSPLPHKDHQGLFEPNVGGIVGIRIGPLRTMLGDTCCPSWFQPSQQSLPSWNFLFLRELKRGHLCIHFSTQRCRGWSEFSIYSGQIPLLSLTIPFPAGPQSRFLPICLLSRTTLSLIHIWRCRRRLRCRSRWSPYH